MNKQMNVYRSNGDWAYALFIDGEYDCSDVLDVIAGANESDAISEARRMHPDAIITRVNDVTA